MTKQEIIILWAFLVAVIYLIGYFDTILNKDKESIFTNISIVLMILGMSLSVIVLLWELANKWYF